MKNEDTFKNLHLYEDEETIQKTLRYLEIHDPENATRDYAIGFPSKIGRASCRERV